MLNINSKLTKPEVIQSIQSINTFGTTPNDLERGHGLVTIEGVRGQIRFTLRPCYYPKDGWTLTLEAPSCEKRSPLNLASGLDALGQCVRQLCAALGADRVHYLGKSTGDERVVIFTDAD